MRYYVFGDDGEFTAACLAVCDGAGLTRTYDPGEAAFGLAPLLRQKLPRFHWSAPAPGTLIFHPSILPYHRGPDAIRWALRLGERISGVTWFWCDSGLDTGPVCEQEAVLVDVRESAGRAYHTRFAPAGLRALARAVAGIAAGDVRAVPQEAALASYESFVPFPRTREAVAC